MPRTGSISEDVVQFLRSKPKGATMAEIGDAVRVRRGAVLQHSVRSAVYGHLDGSGEKLFRRETSDGKRRGRYFLNS